MSEALSEIHRLLPVAVCKLGPWVGLAGIDVQCLFGLPVKSILHISCWMRAAQSCVHGRQPVRARVALQQLVPAFAQMLLAFANKADTFRASPYPGVSEL